MALEIDYQHKTVAVFGGTDVEAPVETNPTGGVIPREANAIVLAVRGLFAYLLDRRPRVSARSRGIGAGRPLRGGGGGAWQVSQWNTVLSARFCVDRRPSVSRHGLAAAPPRHATARASNRGALYRNDAARITGGIT